MEELATINVDPTEEEIKLIEAQDSQNPENVAKIIEHEEDGLNIEQEEGCE